MRNLKKVILIMVTFSLFFNNYNMVKAEPLTFVDGFDPLKYLAGTLLISEGIKIYNENALNAIATDFLSNISQVDKNKLMQAVTTGYITVSPSMYLLLKNYVNNLPNRNGTIIKYQDVNMTKVTTVLDTINYQNVFVYLDLDINSFVNYAKTNDTNMSKLPLLGSYKDDRGNINYFTINYYTTGINRVPYVSFAINNVAFFTKNLQDLPHQNIRISTSGTDIVFFIDDQVFTKTGKNIYVTRLDPTFTFDMRYAGNLSYALNANDYAIDDLYPNDLTNRQIVVPRPVDGTAIDSLNDLVGKNYRDLSISAPMVGDVPVTDVDVLTNIWGVLTRFFDLSLPVNWQPMQAVGTVVTNKFPFSLPWDIARGVQGIQASPERPKIDGDWPIPGLGTYHVKIEIPTWMDPFFEIVRGGVVVLFVAGLIFAHARLMGGQK